MSPAVAIRKRIEAPPERVWELVMDPRRLGDWVTTHHSLAEDAPAELGEGSTFGQTLKLGGVKFEVTWTVAEAERPRLVRWEGDGPAGSAARVRYTLEPDGEGATLFGYENEFELPGGVLGRVAGKTFGKAPAEREAERSLENLGRLASRDDRGA